MKNKMTDVRDHLCAMLETLGDADCGAEAIERAKATALVADKYIASVKCEIDARRVLGEFGTDLPQALEAPKPDLRAIGGRRA